MPFTPFHFGPGAAFKAAAPAQVSFLLFCGTQVVTDLETGYHLITNQYPLHTFFHTFPGATVVAAGCALVGRPMCQWVLRLLQEWSPNPAGGGLGEEATISWRSAFFTTFIGTYSHVFLDAMLHSDVRPFNPFSEVNPFFRLISPGSLHLTCVALGVVGVVVWAVRKLV